MLRKKTVSSRTRAWNYFLHTDAKPTGITAYKSTWAGDQIWYTWSLMIGESSEWHRKSTSGSCIIWTSPWAFINSVLVTYKHLAHLLQNSAYPHSHTHFLSCNCSLACFGQNKQAQNDQKSWGTSSVLMCLGWRWLENDHARQVWGVLICPLPVCRNWETSLRKGDSWQRIYAHKQWCLCSASGGCEGRCTDDHLIASLSWLAEKLWSPRSECGSRKAKQPSWLHT